MLYRISVDFNTMNADAQERVYLNTLMYAEALAFLAPDVRLMVFDEEFEVEALAEFDEAHAKWYGRPIWSTRRDYSL